MFTYSWPGQQLPHGRLGLLVTRAALAHHLCVPHATESAAHAPANGRPDKHLYP